MFLIYIDESGKPIFDDPEDYALAAFMVNEKDWQEIDNQVRGIKFQYFPHLNDVDVELHAKEIFHRKRVFSTLDPPQVFHLLNEVYTLISHVNCVLIGVLIQKRRIKDKKLDMELWGYRLLIERVCRYLEKKNKDLMEQGLRKEYGILLIDSINDKYDMKLRRKLLPFLTTITSYVKNNYLIEHPLFVKSHYRNMAQLTDLVAYCVRRKFRTWRTSFKDKEIYKYFQKIHPKFDTDAQGKIEDAGLKIFPPSSKERG